MKPSSALKSCLKRFAASNDGAAAIEFLFVIPLLVTIYVGTFEGSKLYELSRKTTSATETMGDLVGRTKTVSAAELDKVFDVSRAIVAPFDADKLDSRITAVALDTTDGKWKVEWSRKDGETGLKKGAVYPLSEDLKENGSPFYIIVDTHYSYESPMLHSVVASSLDIERQFAMLPRLSATIPCTDC